MRNLAIFKESLKMSMQNIRNSKMRSFLTTLGIVIGVTAVISLITIVQGVSASIVGQFSDLGAGTLTVNANGTPLKRGLTDTDINNITEIENVAGVSPTVSITGTAVHEGAVEESIAIEGKNQVYFQNNDNIAFGRPLTSLDMSGDVYVCVIDADCAENLFFGKNPIGETMLINGFTYTVVGLQGKDDNLMAAMMGDSSATGKVIIPYKNSLVMSGTANVTSLEVYIKDTNYTDQIIDDLEISLNEAFNDNEDSYYIFNMDSLLETMNSMTDMIATMLAGIASIALLVGGIGIMNMMLVSVTERTKEIGLRKALGAEPSRIQLQFLIESVFLSLLGGIIGVILGLLISYVAAVVMSTTFTISGGAIGLGVGFSAAVGIIFGWVPAKRASELNPIDALRSE